MTAAVVAVALVLALIGTWAVLRDVDRPDLDPVHVTCLHGCPCGETTLAPIPEDSYVRFESTTCDRCGARVVAIRGVA